MEDAAGRFGSCLKGWGRSLADCGRDRAWVNEGTLTRSGLLPRLGICWAARRSDRGLPARLIDIATLKISSLPCIIWKWLVASGRSRPDREVECATSPIGPVWIVLYCTVQYGSTSIRSRYHDHQTTKNRYKKKPQTSSLTHEA